MQTNQPTNNNPAFTLTVDQLEELFKSWMGKSIENLPFQPSYLRPKEMAEKLCISLKSLSNYKDEGLIPHIKLGKNVLYCEQDVYKALRGVSSKG